MRDFDRLFTDFFSSPLVDNGGEARSWYLPLDIVDRGQAYQVKAAVPEPGGSDQHHHREQERQLREDVGTGALHSGVSEHG